MSIYRLLWYLKKYRWSQWSYFLARCFFRCQISCAHKEAVEASKNIRAMLIAWKVTFGMSHKHWLHANVTRFQKNNLGYFWPRLPKRKVCFFSLFGQGYQRWNALIFLGHFWLRITMAKVFDFDHFWPRIPMVKVLFFPGHFWPRLATVKALFFLGHFWPRIPMVKVLVGLGHFWPRIPMVKLLLGLGHFWPRLPTVKVCFSWTFLAEVTFIGHFGYEYQWGKLCLWYDILSNLWHPALPNTSSHSQAVISGTPLCKQEFALWEATAGMRLQVQVHSYTGRQALAWKYDYLVPQNGTC